MCSVPIVSSDLPDDRQGDGGKAHDLSAEGKRHQAEQDRLDDQASDWIFNGTSPPPADEW